jgi:hypothetical protein
MVRIGWDLQGLSPGATWKTWVSAPTVMASFPLNQNLGFPVHAYIADTLTQMSGKLWSDQVLAVNNGKSLAAENRRSHVLQLKQAGETETAIAELVGVSKTQVHNDIHRRLSEVRRDDKEAVQQEYNLQRSRYERLLLRWWSQATGPDDERAAKATQMVLDILRRLDTIGGLIPEKPLIQLQQQNVMVGGVTFADLLREAMDGAGQIVEGERVDMGTDLAVGQEERTDD